MCKKNILLAAIGVIGFSLVTGQAYAHSYYNLTGPGPVVPEADPGAPSMGMGLGLTNSINGTDGVSANSNGTNRVAGPTTPGNIYDPVINNMIPGTGSAAETATEVSGNLPYMWYSGQHSTATGRTKRELYTGSTIDDNTGNLFGQVISGAQPTLPNGRVLPGTVADWGANSLNGLWRAYNTRNDAVPSSYAPYLPDPSAAVDANGTVMDHPYLAVAGNSANTGLGLDYGLIHISCGANSASDNCASAGDILTTITITNDSDYPAFNGLLDAALYRNADSSLLSDRNAAYTMGASDPQGSNLGDAIWTASMSSISDILYFEFIFDQDEWNATGTPGFATNGFYTLIIGAHGGLATNGVMYDVLVTTSPVPLPAAVWLFGSALIGLVTIGRRRRGVALG